MHIDATVLAAVIRITFGLLCLVAVVQFMVIPTMVEHFRQDAFALRRSLFMLVADDRIASRRACVRASALNDQRCTSPKPDAV